MPKAQNPQRPKRSTPKRPNAHNACQEYKNRMNRKEYEDKKKIALQQSRVGHRGSTFHRGSTTETGLQKFLDGNGIAQELNGMAHVIWLVRLFCHPQ